MPVIPEWLRSVILTFAVTFGTAILAPGFEFSQAALVAAAVTAIRTAVSALLPGGSFGTSPIGTGEFGDE
jgi:hypothetical protein